MSHWNLLQEDEYVANISYCSYQTKYGCSSKLWLKWTEQSKVSLLMTSAFCSFKRVLQFFRAEHVPVVNSRLKWNYSTVIWTSLIINWQLTGREDRLTTAGEGMWMIDTERGRMWLTSWQRTVPLDKASPRSSGRVIFSRDSRVWGQTDYDVRSLFKSLLDHPLVKPKIITTMFCICQMEASYIVNTADRMCDAVSVEEVFLIEETWRTDNECGYSTGALEDTQRGDNNLTLNTSFIQAEERMSDS